MIDVILNLNDPSRDVKVWFSQVQSNICRTENRTLGLVLTMYRTLDRSMVGLSTVDRTMYGTVIRVSILDNIASLFMYKHFVAAG